jgi:hypothetical protein
MKKCSCKLFKKLRDMKNVKEENGFFTVPCTLGGNKNLHKAYISANTGCYKCIVCNEEVSYEDLCKNWDIKCEEIDIDVDKDWFLKFILNSHCYSNYEDRHKVVAIRNDNKILKNIDKQNIKDVLGKKYNEYHKNNHHICSFTYDPIKNSRLINNNGITLVNTYNPPAWREDNYLFGSAIPEAEIPDIYQCILKTMIKDASTITYLLDWMSNSIQSRNLTMLCLIGSQGTGKTTLCQILSEIHGENGAKTTDRIFKETYNSSIANKTFVYFEEVDIAKKECITRLKDLVNDNLEIRKMYEDSHTTRNFASYALCSNHYDSISIESTDRRFSIIDLTDKQFMTIPELIARLRANEHLDPENIKKFAQFLYNRKISNDMTKPYRATRYNEVKLAGLRDWED